MELLELSSLASDAAARAEAAATQSGVVLSILTSIDQLEDAERLFCTVWSVPPERPPVSVHIMRALSHAGSYVAGAYDGGALVAAAVGFLGLDGEDPFMHSHILGVLPAMQGRNVGATLKQHQRGWALQRGITKISWTFDPLVRRNAFFNLTKLGAEATSYHSSFYGSMDDEINQRDESDRLVAMWRLDSPRAVRAANGEAHAEDIDGLLSVGASILLDEDASGGPIERPISGTDRAPLLCKTPADIVALRSEDPDLARSWRLAMRHSLGNALGNGYVVTSVSHTGWYALQKPGN